MPAGNPYGSCNHPRQRGSGAGGGAGKRKLRKIFAHHRSLNPIREIKKQPPANDHELARLLMTDPSTTATATASTSPQKTKSPKNNKDCPLVVAHYAINFADACRAAKTQRSHQIITWNTLTLVLTVLTVAAAVLYGHIYGSMPQIGVPSDVEGNTMLTTASAGQWILYASTIMLPIAVAWVIKSRLDFLKNGDPYTATLALTESELYKFRARVPPYKKNATAETTLINKLQEIYQSQIVDKNHTLDLDESFWKLDDEQGGAPSIQPLTEVKQQSQEQIISPTTVLEEFEQTSYATLPYIPSESQRNVTVVDLEAPQSSDATTTGQANAGEQTLLLSGPKTADRNDNRKPSALIDDGRSELTPKEYQVLRLQKQLQDQSSNLENLSTQKLYFETTSRYLTLSTGFLAIASYQWIVPILLAVAAATLQVVDFAGLDSKCSKTESASQQLKRIQKWWMESVNLQDQKWELRRLVQETEAVVVAAV